ncbi:---NA---, partial [Paramuricea clavata]
QLDNTEFNEAQKILENVKIPSKKDESEKNRCFGEIAHDVLVYETIQELKPKAIDDGLQDGDNKKRDSHKAGTIGVDTASKSVYATCQNSGVPWLSCKSIAKWANDECQNLTWCQFGAAVSASYVQHVLKRFYIPDEVQVHRP